MAFSDGDLCDRYERLHPGAVADSLDALGYERRTLSNEIGPLTTDTRMAGLAFPVRGGPDRRADYDSNIERFLQMFGDAPEDSVVAYETNDERAAHLGELSTTALAAEAVAARSLTAASATSVSFSNRTFPSSLGTKRPRTRRRDGDSTSGTFPLASVLSKSAPVTSW